MGVGEPIGVEHEQLARLEGEGLGGEVRVPQANQRSGRSPLGAGLGAPHEQRRRVPGDRELELERVAFHLAGDAGRGEQRFPKLALDQHRLVQRLE
jgi:hypothetical protein